MLAPKKSDCARLTLTISHPEAPALAASLVTEADFSLDGQTLTVVDSADSIVDLRARWNSLMRGLIASELAVSVSRGE